MHTDPPVVVSLKEADSDYSERVFVLNCTSSSSPATNVYWTKNNVLIPNNATYRTVLQLLDRQSSKYSSLLHITATTDDLLGTYSCLVQNIFGFSEAKYLSIEGQCQN